MPATDSPSITVTGDAVTAALAGEFDMAATFTAEPALERALEVPGLRDFTLDLSGLTFIDSLGIGVVIELTGELESRGIPLRIVPGPEPVQRVFAAAGIDDVLPFEPHQDG